MIEAVAMLLIALAILSWGSAWILLREALKPPRIRFLTAVAIAALVGAAGASAMIPLALDVLHPDDLVARSLRFVLLVGGVVIFSLPGPAFLILYWFGFFGEVEH